MLSAGVVVHVFRISSVCVVKHVSIRDRHNRSAPYEFNTLPIVPGLVTILFDIMTIRDHKVQG